MWYDVIDSYRSANRVREAGRRLQATVEGDAQGVHIPGSQVLIQVFTLTKVYDDSQD